MLNNITLHITNDYNELSLKAAQVFAAAVNANPTGNFGFATGSSPVGMYKELIKMSQKGEVNLQGITAFNLDEYYPLDPSDPQSYSYFMAENLFDAIELSSEKRNIPKGDAPDPIAECKRYEEKIASSGGINMQILGIGNNGHIGFNEPSDVFAGQTNYVQLAEDTITANARFFDNADDVPKHALTMGIQSIMMSKSILLVASGEGKAKILHEALTGAITPNIPASVLQLHPNVTIVADKTAAKYFN